MAGSGKRGLRHSRPRIETARERVLGVLLAVACLLVVVGAGNALADGPETPAQEATSFVPGWTSEQAQEEAVQESDPGILAPPSTDPEAAEDLPHDDLGRAEASDLLTAVFGEVLDEAIGIFDELEVERFRSDYVAVIEPEEDQLSGEEDEEPGLLTSQLPLRAENSEGEKALIDLDLHSAEGVLRPENPLVEVEIPAEWAKG